MIPAVRPRARLTLLLLAALCFAALRSAPVRAVTFTVTTVADTGPGSLRDAILQANAQPGADTITFAVTGTITLASTLPAIADTLTIQGPGAASLSVSGGNMIRLLQVNAGAQLTLEGLTLTQGRDTAGGAIENHGSLTITNSTLSGNQAVDLGGTIFNRGTLSAVGTTFGGNQAPDDGGAIRNFGTVSVTNSTFSSNQGDSRGGAITSDGGTVAITNSTFGGNLSGAGVLWQDSSASFSLHNVVFANTAASCAGSEQVTDQGGNIAADASCPFTQPSSRSNTDPLLGPLQSNGGPTQTMALLPGSPAIDAGVNCPPPTTDQRGEPRTTPCDSGAVETEAAIGSLSPTSGPEAGGTLVTITGSGFVPGQTSVSFGLTPALSVGCQSSNQCTAVSPPGTGTVDVIVTVVGRATVVGSFTYEPLAPAPPRPMTLAVQVWRQIPRS